MAIALSIIISLVAGITVMYQTQYFWGKEGNSNINNINCSMNNLSDSIGSVSMIAGIVSIIGVLVIVALACSCRGF